MNIYGMKTQEGNDLVRRIVDAAIMMIREQGAEFVEATEFVRQKLEQLAAGEGYTEAYQSCVRMTAYYDVHTETKDLA